MSYVSLTEFRYRFYVAFLEHVIAYSDVMISSSVVGRTVETATTNFYPPTLKTVGSC